MARHDIEMMSVLLGGRIGVIELMVTLDRTCSSLVLIIGRAGYKLMVSKGFDNKLRTTLVTVGIAQYLTYIPYLGT